MSRLPTPVESVEEITSGIYQTDALEALESMPANSVHCVVTSPPYFQKRDYGHDDQLGLEETPTEYAESVREIMAAVKRVLRPDGTLWINLADTYQDKSLLGIPSRVARRLRDDGWLQRNRICWNKRNGSPDSSQDRLTSRSETVFYFASSGSYWFDTYEEDAQTDVWDITVRNNPTNHHAVFPEELPKRILRLACPPRVCPECGRPHERVYEEQELTTPDPDRPQSKRAIEIYQQSDLTPDHLEACRAIGMSDTGQKRATQSGAGNNTDRVEELAAEAKEVLGSYTREFISPPKEFVGWDTECNCNADGHVPGIVLDPFMGSGTTACAAKDLCRRFLGFELNEDYVVEAQKRVGITVSDPDRLLGPNETNLTAFSSDD